MKTIIQLDENDIQEIIAQHFGVDKQFVRVEPFIGTSGYGMAETETASVRAEVIEYLVNYITDPCYNKNK